MVLQTGTKHYFGSFDDMAERFQNPNIVEELSVPFKVRRRILCIRANSVHIGGGDMDFMFL